MYENVACISTAAKPRNLPWLPSIPKYSGAKGPLGGFQYLTPICLISINTHEQLTEANNTYPWFPNRPVSISMLRNTMPLCQWWYDGPRIVELRTDDDNYHAFRPR